MVAVLVQRLGGRAGVAHRAGWVAGEGDERSVQGAGDVVKGDLHRRDVGRVALLRPCQDVAADAASRSVEYPCARVAGGCEATLA
jgi:hypothetical protein